MGQRAKKYDDKEDRSSLRGREKQVMQLLCSGLRNKAIARQLVAEGTVKIHVHHIYQKLGILAEITRSNRNAGNGLAVFDLIGRWQHEHAAVLCAFDVIELDGEDLHRIPIERRKVALAKLLGRVAPPGIVLNTHYQAEGAIVYREACVRAECVESAIKEDEITNPNGGQRTTSRAVT